MDISRAVWVVVIAMAFVISCGGPQGPRAKTGDETRSAAVEIVPGSLVDDRVSRADDPVDWKKFDVSDDTPATLNLYWDNPDVGATFGVRDMYGGVVAETVHQTGAGQDSLEMALKEGTYFIEIVATSGSSVYTLELFLGDEGVSSYGIPRPE